MKKRSFKKYIIIIFLLIGFIGAVFFGFNLMLHNDGTLNNCIVSKMNTNTECLSKGLESLFSHTTVYRLFTGITINSFYILLILLLIVFNIIVLFWKYFVFLKNKFYSIRILNNLDILPSRLKKITHWLALLENSPSFLYKA